jgi:NhaA family Na+:H+ antiporter
VFGFAWLAIRTGLARLPAGASWLDVYGVAILCGIGFTMSLFISSLAFQQDSAVIALHGRLGILAGSLLSAGVGYALLRYSLGRGATQETATP